MPTTSKNIKRQLLMWQASLAAAPSRFSFFSSPITLFSLSGVLRFNFLGVPGSLNSMVSSSNTSLRSSWLSSTATCPSSLFWHPPHLRSTLCLQVWSRCLRGFWTTYCPKHKRLRAPERSDCRHLWHRSCWDGKANVPSDVSVLLGQQCTHGLLRILSSLSPGLRWEHQQLL